jgi:dienelactone hydrolase
MIVKWFSALVAGVLLVSCAANAQGLLGSATQAKDLTFPSAPSSAAAIDGSRMALLKPNGSGPFPAIVLHHQCGGLHNKGGPNRSSQRGVDSVCLGSKNGVNFPRGVRDAMQGADYLRTLPYVDKKRIAHVGFSWGAMVALLDSNSNWRAVLPGSEGFAATVALYPGCFTIEPNTGAPPFETVQNRIDHPVLVLMGDKDIETPPDECLPKLQVAKEAGLPVEWHVFPNATHCWDCEGLNGVSKTDFRGTHLVYHFDAAATQEAKRRIFEFLERTWTASR